MAKAMTIKFNVTKLVNDGKTTKYIYMISFGYFFKPNLDSFLEQPKLDLVTII